MSRLVASRAGSGGPVPAFRRRPELWFLVRFSLAALIFEVLFLAWGDRSQWFQSYLEQCTRGAAFLLRCLGYGAESHRNFLDVEGKQIAVRSGCDAIEPFALFAIATLLFPTTAGRKLTGAVLGMVAILGLNLVRIGSLAVVQHHSLEMFSFLHLSAWPACFALFTLSLWMLWAFVTAPGRS